MLRRLATLALTLALLCAGLAACGGDDDEDGGGGGGGDSASTTAEAALVEAKPFVSALEDVSGFKFKAQKSSTWTLVGTEIGEDAYGKYGAFSIYVLDSVDSGLDILTDDEKGNAIEPDAEDIYWEQNDEGRWSATKLLGENVVVVWHTNERKKTTDTWDRLTADVEQAIDQASS